MDDKLTKQLQTYLDTPATERDPREGAELYLALSRNRILYQNFLRRPAQLASKLDYELRKYLRIRLDGLTIREVRLLDIQAPPAAADTIKNNTPAQHRGKRTDHDQLPAEIQAIYETNGVTFRKLKEEYAAVRALDNAQPCDRYEHLKLLSELDNKYRAAWERYDNYDDTANAAGANSNATDTAETAKAGKATAKDKKTTAKAGRKTRSK